MQDRSAEQQLIDACRQGDRQAQRRLYEKYYSWALNLCMRYTRHREEAREVLNDGFVKAFTQLHRLDNQRAFQPWLKRILVNTAIDHYRAQGKLESDADIDQLPEPRAPAQGLAQLQYDDLLQAIQYLPPAYRLVFNLYVVEGYSHAEVAQQLHISENTSRSNLKRAREKLQALLTDYEHSILNQQK